MESVLPMRRRSQGSIRSPVVKRDCESVVVIKGWLHKLEGGAIKQWKHRWCVLTDFCLFFYKSSSEDKVFSTVLLPSYKINPCNSNDRISRKYAFKAEHHDMKTYYFAAESKESMKRWMNAMSLASIMQNLGKNDIVESGIGSTSNEEEDSGFTSFRSRRFDHDPNSTFDSSHGSGRLKQKSHSCGEHVGEMYLNSDDKYPSLSNRHHRYKHQTAMDDRPRPRQPVYANAPPKPKRMPQSDPYAISPGEQYNEMGYNMAPNAYDFQGSPEVYNYPDVVTYTSHMANVMNIQMMDHSGYYPNERFHESDQIPFSSSYPREFGNVDGTDGTNSFQQPPRPRSADFLERDMETFEPVQSQTPESRQRQRPKSSMEYYGRYWDSEEYNVDNYRDAVRMQADNLYTNNSRYEQQQHQHPEYVDYHSKYNSNIIASYQDPYESSHIQQPQLPSKPHPRRATESVSSSKSTDQVFYSKDVCSPPSVSYIKKKQDHEESMKRLLEWKQRMLQSPLTKRVVQYSSSSSETGSPRRPPNRPPLPSEYREQVILELESHEAHIMQRSRNDEHSISRQDDDYIPNTPFTDYYPSRNTVPNSSVHSTEAKCHEHHNSIGDLSYSTKDSQVPDEPSMNQSIRRTGNNEENVMYCVDSENNEILIYDDDYMAKDSRCYPSDQQRHSEKSKQSSSDIETNLVRSSSGSGSVFISPTQKPVVQGHLRRTTTQNLNVNYSSDDEASVDTEYRRKQRSLRSKLSQHRVRNASDSEILVNEPYHVQKLVQLSENIMNRGKRLSVSAGDLLGKTHEELVLLLIQLRRNQARILRTKEKCLHQIENSRQSPHRNDDTHQSHAGNCSKIIQQLDKQFEVTRPLINLVDNMVKLGSLYGSKEEQNASLLRLSAPELNEQREKLLQTELRAWSSMEDSDVQDHLSELYGLDQETHSYTSLQQDKEMLETTLNGMRNKILHHQDKPFELQKLRKQQRLIEKELTRVKRLLCHSAKRIEDATMKNDQLEQEILLLRQKLQQALKTGSSELKSSQSRADLEAELSRVQNVLEELANHRHEINGTVETLKNDALSRASCSLKVRASPTGVVGSAPLPLRKKQQSTYFETDLDTMITRDLSNVCRDLDDIPVYANAEEICHEAAAQEAQDLQENGLNLPSGSSDKENLSQCSLQDISDADDRMKRFYGILPREKPCEIKTVRIVKRQSEKRNRDKKRVTYGDNASVWVVEEPDMSSDDHLETDEETFKKIPPYLRPSSILLPYTNPQKSSDRPRARDDVDMERCLRTANTPDIVRSTIKKKEVFDDDIIDRELGLPEKISIPERYIEDEPENLTASERLRRSLKAENIRKMLSETTASYENVAKTSNAPVETVHKTFSEQKRNRAHLLALNHALAQEVMERSKAVAVYATLKKTAKRDKLATIEDLSPMVDLPLSQQRYNLLY